MFKQLASSDTELIDLVLNGKTVQVTAGITVAAMVLSQGMRYTRTTAISDAQRAPFCMMGVCYECLMIIDGQPNQRACATYVQPGMQVEIQQGTGSDIGGVHYE